MACIMIFVLAAGLVAFSCSSLLHYNYIKLTPGTNDIDGHLDIADNKLIARIKQAVDQEIKADNVEAFVGVQADINTTRPGDRDALMAKDMCRDPDRSDGKQVSRFTAVDLVYWRRPINSKQHKFVGIAWNNDGNAEMFYSVLLPPG